MKRNSLYLFESIFTMDEEATQAMLQRMDDQLDDLLRQNNRVESPEREVHSNETGSVLESQSEGFSISSGSCSDCQLAHQNRHPLSERNENPEDIVPKNASILLDDGTYENRSTSTTMSEVKKNILENCSDSYALEASYEIRNAVDSIRREASRVEAALAIDQIQTMRNELQSLTCLVQAQSDQIQHLKKEIKAKDEKLATMELERDLANADLDALKADRDQRKQKTGDVSNAPAKNCLPSRQSRVQKTTACSELTESVSSLSVSSINTGEPNLERDSPPKAITFDSVKSVGLSQKAQQEDRWIQGECSGVIQGQIGMAGRGTIKTAQEAIMNHSLAGKLPQRLKLEGVSPTPHGRSFFPTAPKMSQLAETEANYAQTRETMKLSIASQKVDLISNLPDNTRISRSDSPHVPNTNTRHTESVPKSKKHRSCLCRPKILRSFSAVSVSENRWLQVRGNDWNGRHRQGRRYKGAPCRKTRSLLGDNVHLLSDFTAERKNSLQSQVEELAQRLKISTENSETLRKRLAMISSYYENTISRLQENIISLKKEMSDLEVHWVKQIASVEREKRRPIRISVHVPERQRKKIEATLTEDRAYL